MSANEVREHPKPAKMWGYYNWGALLGVKRTRKEAIFAIENITGHDWSEMKEDFEVHKVIVAEEVEEDE